MSASSPSPGATSALDENTIKPAKVCTPDQWSIQDWHPLIPMLQQRWKFAVLVPLAIGVIGVLYFGFKPAGSYDGYTAGSIILPDKYTDYGIGDALSMFGYMTADQLNSILADMRGRNMSGFIGWILFTLAMIALAAVLSMAYDASSRTAATMLSNDEAMYRFFRDRYESENGKYKLGFNDEALRLPLTIADFSYEWLLRPGALSAYENAPITETYKTAVYRQSRTFLGRLYLLYNDLWFDAGTTTAKRIFGSKGSGSTNTVFADASSNAKATWQDLSAKAKDAATAATQRPTATTATQPPAAPSPAPQPASQPSTSPAPQPAPTAMPTSQPAPTPVSNAPLSPAPASPTPAFKFCGKCGAKISRDSLFCTQCGAKCSK